MHFIIMQRKIQSKGENMKKYFPLVVTLIISIGLTLSTSTTVKLFSTSAEAIAQAELDDSLLPQNITRSTTTSKNIYKVYEKGQLIGVLSDPEKIDIMLDNVYEQVYYEDLDRKSTRL